MVVAICLACMLLDRIANIKTLESAHCIVFFPLKLIIMEYHGIPWNLNSILVPSLFSTAQVADAYLWFPLYKRASDITVLSWVSTDRYLTQS